MKTKILIGVTVLAVTLIAVFLIWQKIIAEKSKLSHFPDSRTVKLFRTRSGKNPVTVVYPGRISAKEHANLFFRVSGPIIENSLELGMKVNQGDLLMRIDPRDYEREVDKLAHELEVMKTKHVYLELEYERMNQLIKSNAVSKTLFDSALSAKDASAAEIKGKTTVLEIAKDRLADTRLTAPFSGRIIRMNIEKTFPGKPDFNVYNYCNFI